MPVNLDSCITGIFVPGNIGASSGLPPVERVMPPVEPTITSSASISNLENTVLAHTLTSTKVVTWSIIGGTDAAKFEISGAILLWLGDGTKDFEAPDDADVNNAYLVTVRATDVGGRTVDQTLTVTVTDVSEVIPWTKSVMVSGLWPVVVSPGAPRAANVKGVMVNL